MSSSNDQISEEHSMEQDLEDPISVGPYHPPSLQSRSEALRRSNSEVDIQSLQTPHIDFTSTASYETPILEQSTNLPTPKSDINTSPTHQVQINLSEDCTICYSTLTTPCILNPCKHLFDSTCFLAWFDLHLSEIDTLIDPPSDSEILACPFCKQSIDSLTEITAPQIPINRNREYIFNQARTMRIERADLDLEDPVDDRCLRYFQNMSVAWGWCLYFGAEEDLLTCRGKDITVLELVERNRARGFEPLIEEGVLVRAQEMESVAEVYAYLYF